MSDIEAASPRAAIEAAFSAAEKAEPVAAPEPAIEAETSSASPVTPANPLPEGDPPSVAPETPTSPEKAEAKPEAAPAPKKTKPLSPPIDWSAEDKAAFATLPENVKRAIHGREAAINQALQQTADARRMNEAVVRTFEPYRAMMAAEGVQDPLRAVDGLLKTAATLQMGSPAQKAQRMTQLIQHYGIDVELLDKALAGVQLPNSEEERIASIVNQKLQPYQAFMGQVEQAQQYQWQQTQQVATQSVQEMADSEKYPHFDQVRTLMADFLDVAQNNGQSMTLDEAYQRACAITPGLMQQDFVAQQQQRVAQKQQAASSIVGRASNGVGGKPNFDNMSLRETIAAQFGGDNRV